MMLDALKNDMDKAVKAADDAKHFKARVEREFGQVTNLPVNLCDFGRDIALAFATSNEEALRAVADAATQAYEAELAKFEDA